MPDGNVISDAMAVDSPSWSCPWAHVWVKRARDQAVEGAREHGFAVVCSSLEAT